MIDTTMIKEKNDRPLIEESIKLYENGFYRSSYIMAWLAGVESLRRRFAEGSKINKSLDTVFKTIKSIESDKKSIDAYVINEAKKSFLITELEYQKLEYFYKMRCIFSHPYEQTPLVNDCEHIIKSMISIILSKDLLLGEDTINDILDKIEHKQSYLPDNEETICNFFKDILDKTDERVYSHILIELSSFYETYKPVNIYVDIIQARIRACLNTIINQKPLDFFFSNDQEIETFIYSSKKTALILFSRPDILQNLTEHIQNIILTELIDGNHSKLIGEIYNTSYELSDNITAKCKNYVSELETSEDIQFFNATKVIDRIVDLLKSLNFNKQNEIGDLLQNKHFIHSLHNCSRSDLRNLGRNIAQSANGIPKNDYGSKTCYYLLSNFNDSYNYPNEFLVGVLLELFIKEDRLLRPKLNLLSTADLILTRVGESKKAKLIKEVISEINEANSVRNHTSWKELEDYNNFSEIREAINVKLEELGFEPEVESTDDSE